MVSNVEIALKASGLSEVQGAIKSIKQSLIDLGKTNEAVGKQEEKAIKDRIALLQKEAELRRTLGSSSNVKPALTGNGTANGGIPGLSNFSIFGQGMMGAARAFSMAGAAGFAANIALQAFKAEISLATEALRAFGSFVLNDVIKPELTRETAAQQIANASMGQLTAKDLLEQSHELSLKHNIEVEDVFAGQKEFQGITGQPKLGVDIADTIASISKARGVPMADLYKLAAGTFAAGDTAESVGNKLRKIVAQGDIGGIPIQELANLGTRFSTLTAAMGGSSEQKVNQANLLLQSSRFGTPEKTMRGAEALIKDVEEGRLRGTKGITKGKEGMEITDIGLMISDIFSKSKGDIGKFAKTHHLGAPAMQLLEAHKATYDRVLQDELKAGKKETEARKDAADAVRKHIEEINSANMTEKQLRDEEDAVLKTSGERFNQALKRLEQGVLDSGIMDKVADLAEVLSYNSDKIEAVAELLVTDLMWLGKAILSVVKFVIDMIPGAPLIERSALSAFNKQLEGIESEQKARKQAKEDKKTKERQEKEVDVITKTTAKPEELNTKLSILQGVFDATKTLDNLTGKKATKGDETQDVQVSFDSLKTKASEAASNLDTLATKIASLADSIGKLNRTKDFFNQ